MKYVKKISILTFMILALVFSCFFTQSLTSVKAAGAEKVVLSVQKVLGNNPENENEDNTDINGVKILSGNTTETSQEKIYGYIEDTTFTNPIIINQEDVVLINADANDIVLISLLPDKAQGVSISNLIANLKINGTSIKIDTYGLNDNIDNSVYVGVFDFSTLKDNGIGDDFTYTSGGHFEFTFSYAYSYFESGKYIVQQDTKIFNFYLLNSKIRSYHFSRA